MTGVSDDRLDALLRAADPLSNEPANEPELDSLVSELAGLVVAGRRRSLGGRRSHRRRRTVLSAGVLAVAIATAAFAYAASAHTGSFGAGTEGDASEWLRSDAPDFRQVVESLKPTDIPLPAGATFDDVVDREVVQGLRDRAWIQVTGVRLQFVYYAGCTWKATWLDAHDRADDAGAAAAAWAITELASLPILINADRDDATHEQRLRVAAAAAHGDADTVRHDATVNCPPAWLTVRR